MKFIGFSSSGFATSPPRTIFSRTFCFDCACFAFLLVPCPNRAMYSFMLLIWSCSQLYCFSWFSSTSDFVFTNWS